MRLHIDFAGPLEVRMFLVIMDAHSKWLEVVPMNIATALNTIHHLYGSYSHDSAFLSSPIVADNGPQFVAEEFL